MSQCYQISAIKQQHPVYQTSEGSDVVILNKTNYIAKMNSILEDETKFLTLCSSSKNESTSKIVSRKQRCQLQLQKDNLLLSNLYKLLRPTGSQQPHIYGLPKTHKKCVTRTHLAYGRFSETAAGQISLFSSRTGCHSLLEQLHPGIFHLCWHHWNFKVGPFLRLSLFFFLTFRVYLLLVL